MKRTLPLLLASVLLLALVCSCNNGSGSGNGKTNAGVIKTDGDYTIPDVNMDGETITVLNLEKFAGMKIDFVPPEDSDDTLDIAIYESNKRLEEQFNFTLVEEDFKNTGWGTNYIDMGNHFIKNANSGDDVYDFIHFPVNQRMELMTNGYIMDLSEFDGLQLDQPWWDTNLNEVISVNGRQYMVSGSANLMPYEAMLCVFFNKDMLSDYGLDNPYEMVDDGTWTLDAMIELGQQACTLNSDPNWNVYEGGTSTVGVSRHPDFPAHFFVGAGIQYVSKVGDGYDFTLESDDFYTALEKIQTIFNTCDKGGIGMGNSNSGQTHYLTLFSNNRCLFTMAEMKAGVELRDAEVDFGYLPMPKLREEQENYVTSETERLHFICIPTTSENPEDVAKILDAMAYDRYKNVVPVYFDSYVTYKGMRDEESLKTLKIMTATRTMDIGVAYGWCMDFVFATNRAITTDAVASMIAGQRNVIEETIDDFVDNYLS